MKRREFIAGLGSAAVWPPLVRAQQQTKATIGWLDTRPGGRPPEHVEGFRRGLADIGFSKDRDVTVEFHTADGDNERLSAVAADLIRRRPAVIVAVQAPAALAAKAATRDIPIIFFIANDPVELGLVASLNRPGGNLTGLTARGTEIVEKRLELLHKAVPAAKTIAVLLGPTDSPLNQAEAKNLRSAARALELDLLVFDVTVATDITPVFATLVERQAGAILVGISSTVAAKRNQVLSHAARYALPTMFFDSRDARAGGLLSYGDDTGDVLRKIGVYTGRILKGEKPADLPVIRSNKFEFVVNLKTAKTLGLNLPPDLVAVADEVIE